MVEYNNESGMFFPGFLISPPTYVTSIQPSYVQSTATRARLNGFTNEEKLPAVISGRKFEELPPSNVKPKTTNAKSIPTFKNVITF